MKKVFMFLTAVMAVLALSVSCNEKDDPQKEDPNKEEKPIETPYEKPITIDGDFADWLNLDEDGDYVTTMKCAADANYEALRSAKVYCDKYYLFIYVEFDLDEEQSTYNTEWVPFHVYLNADNSAATGGYGDEFADADAEWMLETSITNFDPGVFKWWGGIGENGWSWTDPSVEHDAGDNWGALVGEGSGVGMSAGTIDEKTGKGAFEIEISKEMLSMIEFNPDEFTIGFDIQQNWESVGILPNATPDDDNTAGYAPKAVVKVKK